MPVAPDSLYGLLMFVVLTVHLWKKWRKTQNILAKSR